MKAAGQQARQRASQPGGHMSRTHHHAGHWIIRRHRPAALAIGLATVGILLAGSAATSGASARPVPPAFAETSVSSVSFSGPAGPGGGSPTIVITGTHLGTVPPTGTSDDDTSCGPYPANGEVFTDRLYFAGDGDFVAGYSNDNTGRAACIGLVVQSWSPQQFVLQLATPTAPLTTGTSATAMATPCPSGRSSTA